MAAELPVEPFATAAEWRAWLDANHAASPGVWILFAKKGSGIGSVTYEEAVNEALCFGWIDSQAKSVDERTYRQRFTPRGPRSPWSQTNVARVEALTRSRRMRAAGRRAVEAAKADGRWDAAYAGPATIEVPDDLRAALDASPAAAALFAELDAQNRYAILYRIGSVKRPETRARKIAGFVDALARGETPHPRR